MLGTSCGKSWVLGPRTQAREPRQKESRHRDHKHLEPGGRGTRDQGTPQEIPIIPPKGSPQGIPPGNFPKGPPTHKDALRVYPMDLETRDKEGIGAATWNARLPSPATQRHPDTAIWIHVVARSGDGNQVTLPMNTLSSLDPWVDSVPGEIPLGVSPGGMGESPGGIPWPLGVIPGGDPRRFWGGSFGAQRFASFG
jgi:hypothetical protein